CSTSGPELSSLVTMTTVTNFHSLLRIQTLFQVSSLLYVYFTCTTPGFPVENQVNNFKFVNIFSRSDNIMELFSQYCLAHLARLPAYLDTISFSIWNTVYYSRQLSIVFWFCIVVLVTFVAHSRVLGFWVTLFNYAHLPLQQHFS
ncbi:hypothetical protein L9F63_015549, partial [Diploptera punctata]